MMSFVQKNTWWLWSSQFCDDTKRMKTNQIIILQRHITVDEETFNVNIKNNSSNNAKYLKFHCWKVESTRNGKRSAIIQKISYSNLETGRYGPKPGSPTLSGRVASTVWGPNKWSSGPLRPVSNVVLLRCWTQFELSTALWSTCNCHAELNS